MYYVLYQWIRDGAKTIIVAHTSADYKTAQAYFDQRLPSITVDERISLPITAASQQEAIAMGETDVYWTMP